MMPRRDSIERDDRVLNEINTRGLAKGAVLYLLVKMHMDFTSLSLERVHTTQIYG